MKFLKLILIILGFVNLGCSAQNIDSKNVDFVEDFYREYIKIMLKDIPFTVVDQKIDSLINKNCSVKLIKELTSIKEETEEDPFLKAQDCSDETLSTLKVNAIKSDLIEVRYRNMYSDSDFVIIVGLDVMKDNNIKISSLK